MYMCNSRRVVHSLFKDEIDWVRLSFFFLSFIFKFTMSTRKKKYFTFQILGARAQKENERENREDILDATLDRRSFWQVLHTDSCGCLLGSQSTLFLSEDPPVSDSSELRLRQVCLISYIGAQDRTIGLCACEASNLLTKPSPQAQETWPLMLNRGTMDDHSFLNIAKYLVDMTLNTSETQNGQISKFIDTSLSFFWCIYIEMSSCTIINI